ncbi:hypothetical protein [Endozoicomonas sp. YOMI1]|uniref:hypothetical protein n=1 Tax=Endozoicomonas sp. YOMI1 TaxID=2828739 RepID=UPI002148937E|nr:hypothetical protein [Endozoicomonas sp. YOMI1]
MQNNQSGLQDDMDCQYPVTGNLKFSGLLYEDIPGATISKKYIPQLDAFGHYYTLDLSGLVEALGQTRSKTGIFRDPLETVMQEVTNETGNKKFLPARFFNDRTEPFRDRNARCLLELMNYCQNQVFRQNSNTPGHEAPEMGEKCNDARRPLHESSAGRQQDTKAVKDKLRELLLNHSAHLQAVHSRLNEFFQKSQKPSVGSS